MAPRLELFPLAERISKDIAEHIHELETTGTGLFISETTETTAQLLKFWFQQDYCEQRQINFHEGQRDAILAIIYAHEVLGTKSLAELYSKLLPTLMIEDPKSHSEVFDERNQHPKYAAKMATGTGKTWVLNALLIWQYLNAMATPNDERFSANFLIVAPGLIVYDRLLDSFQGRSTEGTRDFETSDIFGGKELFIPENFRDKIFGFLQSSVVTKKDIGRKITGSGVIAITNWHLLAGQEDPDFLPQDDETDITDLGSEIDHKQLANAILPLSPGISAGNSLEQLDRHYRRGEALHYLTDLPSLVVFNDEAHHIHSLKKGQQATEVEWQKSLREIAKTKQHRFIQVDFSATPYNVGTNKAKVYFLHIVVDFDLLSAMNKLLVKTLAVDKRREIAALDLNFNADRDASGNISLSDGQRTMIKAGLSRLKQLEKQFAQVNGEKHPKMMIVCEDTSVVPLVEEFILGEGFNQDEILSVHSGKKSELGVKEWDEVREKLFSLDRHKSPKIVISVLMLREGFDVNNICVIVPLRASNADILLEQTVGRGLRLMWRGESAINEVKQQNRKLLSQKQEPNDFFDFLFIVEHPAFQQFYDDLISGGAAFEYTGDVSNDNKGQIESVDLVDDFAKYDFEIPIIIRDPGEELRQPTIDPLTLEPSKFPVDQLITSIGQGDVFTGEAVENKVRFGDYRVDGGVMSASGYNDYLSRLANRIVTAHGRFTNSSQQYKKVSAFPLMQIYRHQIVGWLDDYIRNRLFKTTFDPHEQENWRVLLLESVAEEIAVNFTALLIELENTKSSEAEVSYRRVSEVDKIIVRSPNFVVVTKCIYPKLPYPANGGGLERDFIGWADSDSEVEALIKIQEYRHDFLQRPYLKVDGMPARYSPDFLVRTSKRVYLVETKAQSTLSDVNVQRKKRSAVNWVNAINELEPEQRGNRQWFYVLAGEQSVRSFMSKSATASNYLETSVLHDDQNLDSGKLF